MLINLTNYPVSGWPPEQTQKAKELYGEIVDYPFPSVPVDYEVRDIVFIAESITEELLQKEHDDMHFTVLCQGEFSLTYAVVSRLLRFGVEVVSAVSERIVNEERVGKEVRKISVFRFYGFRKYS